MGSQVGITGGRENAAVTKNFLNLKQVNAGFDQMCGVAVTQTVGRDLFFIPHCWTTIRKVD